MPGGYKLKRRKKNKYRKLSPEEGKGTCVEDEGKVAQEQLGGSQVPRGTEPKGKKKRQKGSSKKVHVASLPERYEPLEEAAEEKEGPQERAYKRKQKVKKYAKNVGKAVRTGCRYLLIGIQGLANAYSSPFSMSSVVLSSMTR
ncbi:hypothetical protein XENTR_v10013256 [Xenopus tropicalis]|uniref:Uncharacterized protein C1orf115 homolog n=1 Tax=Xenopus tropicalis TaxID=8364 RepID=A0A8J0R3T9_XENTR|nr:uncharacterized protein C1orf115 homolog [Xenopus tropicalis]KAE8600454.1 hypothetical protein XENTR_v10013256 [Xenopus tropicalis]|eukprot:XP_004914848.1 PREDICTED: uncharacterized protein C1orf115 homolog [Xenopus tropicalis]